MTGGREWRRGKPIGSVDPAATLGGLSIHVVPGGVGLTIVGS
jgi:hypothetical protein